MLQGFMIKDICDYPYKDGETYTTPLGKHLFTIELSSSNVPPYNPKYPYLIVYLVEFDPMDISYFAMNNFTASVNKIKIIGKCFEEPNKILPSPLFNRELIEHIRETKNVDDIQVEKINDGAYKLINIEKGTIITPKFFQSVREGAVDNQRIVYTKKYECNIIDVTGEYFYDEPQDHIMVCYGYYLAIKNRKTSIINSQGEVLKIINYPCNAIIKYDNNLIQLSTTAIAVSKASFNFLDEDLNLVFTDWITCDNIIPTTTNRFLCYFDNKTSNIINEKGEKLLSDDYCRLSFYEHSNKYVGQITKDKPPIIIDENCNIIKDYTYEMFMSIITNEIDDYYYETETSSPFHT